MLPSIIERSEFERTVRQLSETMDGLSAEVQARKGVEQSKTLREIRLFCTSHRFGFRLPRGSRQIVCPLGSHVLGQELPYEGDWSYCCDCRRFWSLALVTEFSSKICPCCERQIVRRYLCDRCRVVSVESDTVAGHKEYKISGRGILPYCPGCLMQSPNQVWSHYCAKLDAELITAQRCCSLCEKAMTPGV